MKHTRQSAAKLRSVIALVVATALLLAACGSDDVETAAIGAAASTTDTAAADVASSTTDTAAADVASSTTDTAAAEVASSTTDTDTSESTVESSPSPAGDPDPESDAALAATAVLVPEDVGDGWRTAGDEFLFPNSAELARTVPACDAFAELVFDGGADHGQGKSGVLGNDNGAVFLYGVVFPTEAEAAAMLEAVDTPAFDECWARFNEAAVPTMTFGIESATYESIAPPVLELDADAWSVKFLDGSAQFEAGFSAPDTCICAFVQVGRGVVEVHSTVMTLSLERRTEVVQLAIDKMRSVLEAG